jgi:hypothetical protein
MTVAEIVSFKAYIPMSLLNIERIKPLGKNQVLQPTEFFYSLLKWTITRDSIGRNVKLKIFLIPTTIHKMICYVYCLISQESPILVGVFS